MSAAQPQRTKFLLEVEGLEVTYKDVILALKGLSLRVAEGTIVALLGVNGAGKTTVLRAISGLLAHHQGRLCAGEIRFDGHSITSCAGADRVRSGIAQVMEGRRIFAELTVEENLRLGAFTRRDQSGIRRSQDQVFDLFPVLRTRRRALAGYLSGGEQQMVAIARALMARPRLLLLDEPSLGLAPKIIEQIRGLILTINQEGVSVLLVEQNTAMALSIASYGYLIENGRTVLAGSSVELNDDQAVRSHYLGMSERAERSFREIIAARRRQGIAG